MPVKEEGAYSKYTECMKESFACIMTLSSGSMFSFANSGAVCAL